MSFPSLAFHAVADYWYRQHPTLRLVLAATALLLAGQLVLTAACFVGSASGFKRWSRAARELQKIGRSHVVRVEALEDRLYDGTPYIVLHALNGVLPMVGMALTLLTFYLYGWYDVTNAMRSPAGALGAPPESITGILAGVGLAIVNQGWVCLVKARFAKVLARGRVLADSPADDPLQRVLSEYSTTLSTVTKDLTRVATQVGTDGGKAVTAFAKVAEKLNTSVDGGQVKASLDKLEAMITQAAASTRLLHERIAATGSDAVKAMQRVDAITKDAMDVIAANLRESVAKFGSESRASMASGAKQMNEALAAVQVAIENLDAWRRAGGNVEPKLDQINLALADVAAAVRANATPRPRPGKPPRRPDGPNPGSREAPRASPLGMSEFNEVAPPPPPPGALTAATGFADEEYDGGASSPGLWARLRRFMSR